MRIILIIGFKSTTKKNTDTTLYDEWIFQIVPEELFIEKVEDFLFIGNEYGFYVNYDRQSQKVFVYLMLHEINDNIDNKGHFTRKIKPLYYENYNYNIVTKKASLNYVTSQVSGNMYYQKYSDVKNVYLKDVSFTGTLYNENHWNSGESEYDMDNDKGAFFVGNQYKFSGVSTQSDKTSFATELFKVGIGYVPLLGDLGKAIDAVDLLAEFAKFADATVRDYREEITNNGDYGFDLKDIVPEFGRPLLKTSGAFMKTNNSNDALLFGIHNESYIANTFMYNYRNHFDKWNSRLASSITLDIVEEQIGISQSSVENIASGVTSATD